MTSLINSLSRSRSCLRSSIIMATRSAHWKSLAPFPPAGTPTFAQQQTLEKLPVPPLDATLDKLKKSLRPLAWSDEEYNSTIKKVDEFGTGPATELQQRLEARRNEEGRDHWLEEWWDDAAYLAYRDSVSLNRRCISSDLIPFPRL